MTSPLKRSAILIVATIFVLFSAWVWPRESELLVFSHPEGSYSLQTDRSDSQNLETEVEVEYRYF